MKSASKTNDDLEAYRDIADDVEESEFVPYACHYDPFTVLTKNGELLQTLRISGLSYENLQQDAPDVRSLLRHVIRETIPNDSFAIWLHTIRSRSDLRAPGEFSGFAQELNDAWNTTHQFSSQFSNDVYLTIVHEGQDAGILNPQGFLRGLIPHLDIRWRNAYIDAIHESLDAVVLRLEEALQPFGAERLGLVEVEGEPHSELLRFLNRIINFIDTPIPLSDHDLCNQLTAGEITFSYNSMEVRAADGQRRYAALVTVKDYKEKALPFIDKFLKLPIEFMVTQCINFVGAEATIKQYNDVKKLHEVAEEKELSSWMELDMLLASQQGKITDFGEQQLSIFILADSIKQLERNIRHSISFLGRHGILCFREDLKFEECFWAQMPGNFEFVTRMQPTSIQHMAGFANLYHHPVGLLEHNHWGPCVTTLPTANGTPYFFNFHIEEVGHTLVTGRPAAGKSTLVNFLVTQSMKFQPALYYFDVTNRHQGWIKTIGGTAYSFGAYGSAEAENPPPLNPFSLDATEGNIRFLQRWLSVLLRCGGQTVEEADKQAMGAALRQLYESGKPRHLRAFCEHVTALNPDTAEKFQMWRQGGSYGHFFDHADDLFDQPIDLRGFHIASLMRDGRVIAPLLSYLLQRLTLNLDGRPSLIVLDEAWQLIGQTHIAPELDHWMKRLTEMNAVAILQTSQIEEIAEIPFTQTLMQHVATEIYLPDDLADDIYIDSFGLSEIELSYLELLTLEQRQILIKRMDTTTIADINFTMLDDQRRILSGEKPKAKGWTAWNQPDDERGAP